MYRTREEVESWLEEMKITSYVINEDLTVDVNGDVNLSFKKLKEIPIKFGIVIGDFKVNYYKNIKKESELLKELIVNSNNVKLNKKL